MSDTQPVDPRQVELHQLQKEYRNMEINRRAYAEESQSILRTQQATIDKLRRDNDGLKNEIALIMRGTNRAQTAEQQEAIQSLNEQGEKYLQSIELEKKNIAVMEEQIAIMKQKVLQQRKSMGGVNASRENYLMIQKQIRILENRLDKSLIKFNESSSHNKQLRFQIDDLRRERIVFENIYRKMEKDLQDKKKAMAEIIEISNQSYEQRDNYQMEIAAIEQANRKEQEEFEEQMASLARLLDSELAIPTPSSSLGQRSKSIVRLNTLGATLSSGGGGSPGRTRSAGGLGAAGLNGSNSGLSLQHPYTAPGGGANGGNANGAGGTLPPGSPGGNNNGNPGEIDFRERAQNFEEAFNKIRIATGINDIDELVNTFIKNEEHNFSLFNYVNEQNNEIEKYEEAIAALREEECKYAEESGNDVNQHKEILKDLESKLQTTDAMAEKYELRCQDLTRVIESLKRGMQNIINLMDWDTPEDVILLSGITGSTANSGGNPSGSPSLSSSNLNNPAANAAGGTVNVPSITEINMVNYLGILEKKSIQLLHNYTRIQQLLVTNAKATKSSALELLHGPADSSTVPASQIPGGADPAQSLVTILGAGPKIPMGQEHLHVNPPKADDYRSDEDEDEDEDEARPLTRDELKSRTLNRLQRRIQGLNIAANHISNVNTANNASGGGNSGNVGNSGGNNMGLLMNNSTSSGSNANTGSGAGGQKRILSGKK